MEKALSLQHQVTAYVRREDSIVIQHPNLKVVVGSLSDSAKVKTALSGSDVCISTLGGRSLRKRSKEITDGISLIVKHLETQKVKRFIYLSSFGTGESKNYMPKLLRFIIVDVMLKIPIADHNQNEQTIVESDLQWTIVRPGGLSNEQYNGNYKYGSEHTIFRGNPKISRSNVAAFILDQLSDKSLIKKAVWIYE